MTSHNPSGPGIPQQPQQMAVWAAASQRNQMLAGQMLPPAPPQQQVPPQQPWGEQVKRLRRKIVVIPAAIVIVILGTFVGLVLHAHAEMRYCVTMNVNANGFPTTVNGRLLNEQPASFRCSWNEWVAQETGQG